MHPAFFVVGGFVGLIAILIAVWQIDRHRQLERTRQLRLAAEGLGLEFGATSQGAVPDAAAAWAGLPLFLLGRARQSHNVIRARTDETDVTIMDYRYTVGHGKSTQVCQQTVACISSELLDVPEFLLHPETFADKIASAFGKQDIDLPDYPAFSKMYLLRGPSEPLIRELFHHDALLHFEQNKGLSVEGRGRALVYFRSRKKIAPAELRSFLEQAYRVFALFKNA